jgi:ABC-type sugar transport system ATPase subunit
MSRPCRQHGGNKLLAMHGMGKSFGGRPALQGVDFHLQRGEVHALVGHNGAGKSTLMKILGGQIPVYEGQIRLDGRPLLLQQPRDAIRAGIAVIGQELSLVPTFTRSENMFLGCEVRNACGGLDSVATQRCADAILHRIGFTVPDNLPVQQLPLAQQQMVEIARALQRNVRVVVMDEPTARLALPERRQLFAAIRQLCTHGVGVVYISHCLEEVLRIAQRITILRDGVRIHMGPALDVSLAQLRDWITGPAAIPTRPLASRSPPPAETAQRPLALKLHAFSTRNGAPNNLEVRSGEVLGLAGCVGSGRSTLLEAIAGVGPHQGSMHINGSHAYVRSPHMASKLGVFLLPEDRKRRGLVMPSSTGFNLVLSALERHLAQKGLVRSAACRASVLHSLALFAIRDSAYGQKPIHQLSGGNQQKVLLARACASHPALLLLDHPTVGVDSAAKVALHAHVRRLAAQGVACIFVSDELDELRALADTIVVMRQGRAGPRLDPGTVSNAELLHHIESTQWSTACVP